MGCVSACLLTLRPLITRVASIVRSASQQENPHGEVREISDPSVNPLPLGSKPRSAWDLAHLGVLGSLDSDGRMEPEP